MYVRRDGCGRYVPRWISLWRSSRLGSRSASKSCHVTPSTPGAALRLSARNAVRSVSALRWWRSAVNRSFFLCLAACRTRLSTWVTRLRLWVRCVLCWSAFPLAPALGSTASATGSPALFGGFTAVESGEVELSPCLRPLAQTARAVVPQAAFLCGSRWLAKVGSYSRDEVDQPHEAEVCDEA